MFSSWMNDRMPDMLWAVIIRGIGDQDSAITEFRRILTFVGEHENKESFYDLSLTGIAELPDGLRRAFIGHILSNPTTAHALATLRLFESLPTRKDWVDCLPDSSPDVDLLLTSVGLVLPHQSQEATDCRWVRLMGHVLSGKFHIPRDMAEELLNYPYVGDQRKVRPTIRASEMAEDPTKQKDDTWPRAFWDEAWHATPCLSLQRNSGNESVDVATTRPRVSELRALLEAHWSETHTTTDVDARHDAVFGIAFYALRLIDELLSVGNSTGVLGRLGLRTILELYLSLHYLLSQDDQELWKKWREYGAGQAKLNALRFDVEMEPPKHINTEWLEQIAGEDLWEEFRNIELGSWSGIDLRRLSDRSGTKEVYDAHYSWSSGYVHGTWGAVREACYVTCGNPLHRLHRYPNRNPLQDALPDSVTLTDLILEDVNEAYPSFIHKLAEH